MVAERKRQHREYWKPSKAQQRTDAVLADKYALSHDPRNGPVVVQKTPPSNTICAICQAPIKRIYIHCFTCLSKMSPVERRRDWEARRLLN